MSQPLRFADRESRDDALIFAGRAARLGEDAIRLQASGGVMAMTAPALTSHGLLDATPTVLALRTVRVDPELECDLVVSAGSLSADGEDETALVLPPTSMTAPWAGVSPPRGGWSELAAIDAETLARRAQWGMAAVARAVPASPGEDAVRAVRAQVWGATDADLDGLPLGVAFAAFTLGFIGGAEQARVLTSGRWTRVSLTRGHILVRGPVASGLTAVRSTGPASV